jgi:lysyl-tRNA synthetase class 1
VWHIHGGEPPAAELPISFGLLLNLVAASNAHDKDVLWGFIRRHAPEASAETHPLLDQLAGYAVRYYEDFVQPKKKFRLPDEVEAGALRALSEALAKARAGARAEDLQTLLYDVGRAIPRYQDLNAKGATPDKPGVSNAWFGAIYQVLLGEERGPRFGSFIELYGVENTRALIEKALRGELARSG